MQRKTLRAWGAVHKWSSLLCTAFMLLLCLTGLPLIFYHELSHSLGNGIEVPVLPAEARRASLDEIVASARDRHPGLAIQFLSQEADEPDFWYVTLGATPTATTDRKSLAVDARSAAILAEPRFTEGFLWFMYRLHTDLYVGLPGKLFLGAMGMLLLVAIVSGIALYAPFMRHLPFGTCRQHRAASIRWLDRHNLIGIVTALWLLVIAATGVINTWADPLIKLYQYRELSGLQAQGKSPTTPGRNPPSLTSALRAASPDDQSLAFIAFPGTPYTTAGNYAFFFRGNTPLTAKLVSLVLVDAASGEISARRELPWYLKTLLLSQPLHFGDYGGLPLKIVWALLDILTIIVLGSGLYLWWKKRGKRRDELLHEATEAQA